MNFGSRKRLAAVVVGALALAVVIVLVISRGANPISTVSYACKGGASITAAYYKGAPAPTPAPGQPPTPTGSVALTLSDGRAMKLQQTISADGIRYANADESFVFWSKGEGALVLENGQEKSYIGCIAIAPSPDLPHAYINSAYGFSIRLPLDYTTDESYQYTEQGPGKEISGVKFTIPAAVAAGTNLASDSYVSVEEIPRAQECTATLFMWQGVMARAVTDTGTDYSFASSTGAATGNRYEESVYALPDTNPCIAVRYVIHYGVIDNYPPGAVREFDQQALLATFDAIRRTLRIVQ